MATYKVQLDRKACIGAGSCVHAYPDRWKMNDDGKVDLIGGEKKENNKLQEVEIDDHEIDRMLEAAQSCPVNAIHVIAEKGHKLI